MKQARETLSVRTCGPGFTDITGDIRRFVTMCGVHSGLLTVFVRHTSASLTIQENADPDVLHDLEAFFTRLVSRDPNLYCHTTEGPDDMPSHIRSALTQTSLSIPVANGGPVFGTWQAIYLFEHRDAPHSREIVLHAIGD